MIMTLLLGHCRVMHSLTVTVQARADFGHTQLQCENITFSNCISECLTDLLFTELRKWHIHMKTPRAWNRLRFCGPAQRRKLLLFIKTPNIHQIFLVISCILPSLMPGSFLLCNFTASCFTSELYFLLSVCCGDEGKFLTVGLRLPVSFMKPNFQRLLHWEEGWKGLLLPEDDRYLIRMKPELGVSKASSSFQPTKNASLAWGCKTMTFGQICLLLV